MKKILVSSLAAFALGLSGHAYAQYAGAVVSYTPGTLVNSEWDTGDPFNNPDAMLGAPAGIVDPNTYPNVYSPFSPPDDTTSLTGIGYGGSIVLELQDFVTVSAGQDEIGIWSNVGLDDNSGNGTTGSPATTLGTPASAVVSVSANGTNWVALNGGNPITFGLPGNYYQNAGPYDSSAPANPQLANFGQPFTGTLSSFDNEDYDEILATLDGSAGGTWLDLDGTGLSEVGYIEFQNVTPDTELDLSTVSINSALAGGPVGAVPEPGTTASLVLGAAVLLLRFNRRRFKRLE